MFANIDPQDAFFSVLFSNGAAYDSRGVFIDNRSSFVRSLDSFFSEKGLQETRKSSFMMSLQHTLTNNEIILRDFILPLPTRSTSTRVRISSQRETGGAQRSSSVWSHDYLSVHDSLGRLLCRVLSIQEQLSVFLLKMIPDLLTPRNVQQSQHLHQQSSLRTGRAMRRGTRSLASTQGEKSYSELPTASLILRVFRLNDFLDDSSEVARTLLEILPCCSTSSEIQEDIISLLPELVDNSALHQEVIAALEGQIARKMDFTPVCFDAYSSIPLDSSIVDHIRSSAMSLLSSCPFEYLPLLVRFLISNLPTDPTDASDIVVRMRTELHTALGLNSIGNRKFSTQSKLKNDDDNDDEDCRPRPRSSATNSATHEATLLDAVLKNIKFSKHSLKIILKVLAEANEGNIFDFWLVFGIHSSIPKLTTKMESLFKAKISRRIFTIPLLHSAIQGHALSLAHHFPSLLSFAELLLRTPAKFTHLKDYGVYLYQLLFIEFDDRFCRQETIVALLTHLGGANDSLEVDYALIVLEKLCQRDHTRRVLISYEMFLEKMLDVLETFTMQQIRRVYGILVRVAYQPVPSVTSSKHLETTLNLLLRKQLGNPSLSYRRMGVLCAMAVIVHMDHSNEFQVKQALNVLRFAVECCERAIPSDIGFLLDEICGIVSNSNLSLSDQIVEEFEAIARYPLEDQFVIDIELSSSNPDQQTNTASFSPSVETITPEGTSLWLNLDGNETSIAISIAPSSTNPLEGMVIPKLNVVGGSRLSLPARLRCAIAIEKRKIGTTTGVDGLLGCPLIMPEVGRVCEFFDSVGADLSIVKHLAMDHTLASSLAYSTTTSSSKKKRGGGDCDGDDGNLEVEVEIEDEDMEMESDSEESRSKKHTKTSQKRNSNNGKPVGKKSKSKKKSNPSNGEDDLYDNEDNDNDNDDSTTSATNRILSNSSLISIKNGESSKLPKLPAAEIDRILFSLYVAINVLKETVNGFSDDEAFRSRKSNSVSSVIEGGGCKNDNDNENDAAVDDLVDVLGTTCMGRKMISRLISVQILEQLLQEGLSIFPTSLLLMDGSLSSLSSSSSVPSANPNISLPFRCLEPGTVNILLVPPKSLPESVRGNLLFVLRSVVTYVGTQLAIPLPSFGDSSKMTTSVRLKSSVYNENGEVLVFEWMTEMIPVLKSLRLHTEKIVSDAQSGGVFVETELVTILHVFQMMILISRKIPMKRVDAGERIKICTELFASMSVLVNAKEKPSLVSLNQARIASFKNLHSIFSAHSQILIQKPEFAETVLFCLKSILEDGNRVLIDCGAKKEDLETLSDSECEWMLSEMAENFLHQEWKKKILNKHIELFLRDYLRYGKFSELGTRLIDIHVNALSIFIQRQDGIVADHPSLNSKTFFSYVKECLMCLISHLKATSISANNSNDDPPSLIFHTEIHSWIAIFQQYVELVRDYDDAKLMGNVLRYGTLFIDTFVQHSLRYFERVFLPTEQDTNRVLRKLQQVAHILHDFCDHSKVHKSTSIGQQVPRVKKSLEVLLYRVGSMLVANHVGAAFWVGTLKNRDLKGNVVSSQFPSASSSMPPISASPAPNNPGGEAENERNGGDEGEMQSSSSSNGMTPKNNMKPTAKRQKPKKKPKPNSQKRISQPVQKAKMPQDDDDDEEEIMSDIDENPHLADLIVSDSIDADLAELDNIILQQDVGIVDGVTNDTQEEGQSDGGVLFNGGRFFSSDDELEQQILESVLVEDSDID